MPTKTRSCAVLLSLLLGGCRAKSSLPAAAPSDIAPPGAAVPPQKMPPQKRDEPVKNEPVKNELEAQLVLPQTRFKRGAIVPLVVTLHNNSKQPQTLRFTSGQRYDFWVTKQGSKESVWRWVIDKMFTQNLRTETLAAGATQTFRDEWNQADNAGQIVPRGTYVLHGMVTADKPIEAAPITLELTD